MPTGRSSAHPMITSAPAVAGCPLGREPRRPRSRGDRSPTLLVGASPPRHERQPVSLACASRRNRGSQLLLDSHCTPWHKAPHGGVQGMRVLVKAIGLSALMLALGLLRDRPSAAAARCDLRGSDAASVGAAVTTARAECPCDSFSTRDAFRNCVRDVADDGIASGSLPRRCRNEVMRYARRATCGTRPGKVACCRGDNSCALVAPGDRCTASRNGTGRVGATESCYDACAPQPTPTAPPTPTPPALCCACGCRPLYYDTCGGQHQCSMPAPDVTDPAQCNQFDDASVDCADFFVPCDGESGGSLFPRCLAPATATPTPTPTPGARCVCACDVKWSGSGCPGIHPCVVASLVPETAAECDVFNAIGTGCYRVEDYAAFLRSVLVPPVLECRF